MCPRKAAAAPHCCMLSGRSDRSLFRPQATFEGRIPKLFMPRWQHDCSVTAAAGFRQLLMAEAIHLCLIPCSVMLECRFPKPIDIVVSAPYESILNQALTCRCPQAHPTFCHLLLYLKDILFAVSVSCSSPAASAAVRLIRSAHSSSNRASMHGSAPSARSLPSNAA